MALSTDMPMKRHDTFPYAEFRLSDENGPVNLTGADEVLLLLKSTTTVDVGGGDMQFVVVEGVCEVVESVDGAGGDEVLVVNGVEITVPSNRGWARYVWAEGDTDYAGTYTSEAQVTWSPGQVQTFPPSEESNPTVTIDPDLGPQGS